jgi:anthranilate synthase/aminodeoxychorismate synthase-like glutamine amidotransferase
MILIIDNYDSFTYNLVQYLGELSRREDVAKRIEVFRNDKVTISQIEDMQPEGILISPGPGTPEEAGVSNSVIEHFAPCIPILGVCLGHQCIGHVFGARIGSAKNLMHGKTSFIYHDGEGVYEGVKNPFEATRYHSLAIQEGSLPSCLKLCAWTEDGEIMGVRHIDYPLEGVQFHPESILTKVGKKILLNFLRRIRCR